MVEFILDIIGVIALAGVVWYMVTSIRRASKTGLEQVQERNRSAIEEIVELTCPVHGYQAAETVVRRQDGTLVCGLCYQDDLNRQKRTDA